MAKKTPQRTNKSKRRKDSTTKHKENPDPQHVSHKDKTEMISTSNKAKPIEIPANRTFLKRVESWKNSEKK